MAKVRVEVDEAKLYGVAAESPKLDQLMYKNAVEISAKAQAIFNARQVKTNEWRMSETTPPKYVRSFKVQKLSRIKGYSWAVVNTDPASVWVEYGAHAGGRTFVLRYYPLKNALRAQGVSH